jgi:predicted nucleic-acid-binding protein
LGRPEVKITVDTNVLLRAVVRDDKRQADLAANVLRNAELIAVAVPCLCEFVWVLRRVYGFAASEVAAAIRTLLATRNLETNRAAVEQGLAVLEAGGDFADGAIAYEGRWLGGETFVSFDRRAVEKLVRTGEPVELL